MPVTLLKDFERWDYFSPLDLKLQMVDASDTPFITYENGVPCYEANLYMYEQLTELRSRRVKGGTLRTYANQINHLVRFCYQNKIRFQQLTDATFRLFVQTLQGERDQLGELARKNNHIIQIAHRCLNFLVFIQDFHDLKNFIGIGKENKIRIKIKKYQIVIEGSKNKKESEVITHACVPTKNAVKKKHPVSEDYSLKVWEYINNQENLAKRLRDIALYQCLEQLGARITEIHLITITDIENAINSGENQHLTLTNLKRKDDNNTRSIPVTSALLTDIKQYINKVRKKIIKRVSKKGINHDYLFVSLTTGLPLQSSTLTRYMNIWKNELGIEGELHPHLYRHAFITNKLKEIILQHKDITSADKFRTHLLNTEKFKMMLLQWTGHTHLHSLDIYIDLVFADLNGYNKAYNAVQLKESVTIVRRQLARVKQQLKDKTITNTEGGIMIDEILSAFENDIDKSLS